MKVDYRYSAWPVYSFIRKVKQMESKIRNILDHQIALPVWALVVMVCAFVLAGAMIKLIGAVPVVAAGVIVAVWFLKGEGGEPMK